MSSKNGSNGVVPQHIAIIMDGNGRWAERQGKSRIEGHKAGALSVRKVVEECRRLGVRYLTLYSFSTENWLRPKPEVNALMALFEQYLESELKLMIDNNVRLRAIGSLYRLPSRVKELLVRNIERTKDHDGMDLILAVSYGGREELVLAARQLAQQVQEGRLSVDELDEEQFASALLTAGIPDPDLLIRSSGEMRISNFLLWQLAYSEIVVTEECWPEFDEASLRRCIEEYQRRERRFGRTGEQLQIAARV